MEIKTEIGYSAGVGERTEVRINPIRRNSHMPQSLSQVYIHLVFSTKNRQNLITEAVAPDLYAYMATVLHEECKSTARIIGGVDDHTHTLFNQSRTWCIADIVEVVKTSTS